MNKIIETWYGEFENGTSVKVDIIEIRPESYHYNSPRYSDGKHGGIKTLVHLV